MVKDKREKIVYVKIGCDTKRFKGMFRQKEARTYAIALLTAGCLFISINEEEEVWEE